MMVSNDSKLLAAGSYIILVLGGLLTFFIKKDDKWAKFHAIQSILLGVAFWILGIVFGIVITIFSMIVPFFALLGIFLPLFYLAVMVWCSWKAFNGEEFLLPVIGPVAKNFVK